MNMQGFHWLIQVQKCNYIQDYRRLFSSCNPREKWPYIALHSSTHSSTHSSALRIKKTQNLFELKSTKLIALKLELPAKYKKNVSLKVAIHAFQRNSFRNLQELVFHICYLAGFGEHFPLENVVWKKKLESSPNLINCTKNETFHYISITDHYITFSMTLNFQSHLPKKSLMKNFIFCAVVANATSRFHQGNEC